MPRIVKGQVIPAEIEKRHHAGHIAFTVQVVADEFIDPVHHLMHLQLLGRDFGEQHFQESLQRHHVERGLYAVAGDISEHYQMPSVGNPVKFEDVPGYLEVRLIEKGTDQLVVDLAPVRQHQPLHFASARSDSIFCRKPLAAALSR